MHQSGKNTISFTHKYYQQAGVCEYKQDIQGAINLIKKAIEVNNDDDVMLYTKLGGLYSNIEKYQDAINAYKKALELRSNDAFIYVSLGNIYQITNNNKEALSAYKKALELGKCFFKNIEFAVYCGKDDTNYKVFKEILE